MQMKHYIRDLVYGANDGIVTTFAVVTGVIGAKLQPQIILIIGTASLFADGFSMAASDYLACKSHQAVQEEGQEDAACRNPSLSALFTFAAFVFFGAIPLLPYAVSTGLGNRFALAAGFTASALFITGLLRTLVTKRNPVRGGMEMVLIGGAAAALAYVVGRFIASLGA
ncbi:MAG: VIT1/CCC1 transporter family protein [Desulfovibrionales bacterium]